MAPKYAARLAYLVAQPPDVAAVTLTFPESEQLVGGPLPPGARLGGWWSCEARTKATVRVWGAEGWRARPRPGWAPPFVTFERLPPR